MVGIVFCGDPHGKFEQIIQSVEEQRPEAVVLLGDLDLPAPLHEVMAPVLDMGTKVYWIHGNHDTDKAEWHDRLFLSDLADHSLSGKVVEIAGVRVAGLGGIFRSKVWNPRDGEGAIIAHGRADYLRVFPNERWRQGLPLRHRSTIFPEDLEKLHSLEADILVTHEAPSSHRHGFRCLDQIAEAMGVKAIVHGHHHQAYRSDLTSGIAVFGVENRGILLGSELDKVLGFSECPVL